MPKKRFGNCIYVNKNGDACGKPGIGSMPLCLKHEKFRDAIEAEADESGQFDEYVHKAFDVLSEQPGVKKVIGKVSGLLDKVAGFIDKAATGDLFTSPEFNSFRGGQQHRPQQPVQKPKGEDPRTVLGFSQDEVLSSAVVKARKRELAEFYHPDRPGGNTKLKTDFMKRVNQAADELLKELK